MKVKIAPSILSADFGKLNTEIKKVRNADLLHIDVMDGHFVPNITIGPAVVKRIRTALPLDVHLMISNPGNFIDDFARAGADILTFHLEACRDAKDAIKIINLIKSRGCRPGIAVRPKTDINKIFKYLNMVDFVLVMTVEPGFGGQNFIKGTLDKIRQLRRMMPDIDIEVDGGINDSNVRMVAGAGANVIVSGSYIFSGRNPADAVEKLRKIARGVKK